MLLRMSEAGFEGGYTSALSALPPEPPVESGRLDIRKDLTALKLSIEGIDVENESAFDVAHTLYNLANDAQVILNRLPPPPPAGEGGR